jgi:hypothetical protein
MVTIETDTGRLVKESNGYYRNRHTSPGEGVKWLLQKQTHVVRRRSRIVTTETDTGCLAKESNSYYRNRHRLPGKEAEWLFQCYIETDTGRLAKKPSGYSNVI